MEEPDRRRDDRVREVIASIEGDWREAIAHLVDIWEVGIDRLNRRYKWATRWIVVLVIGMGFFIFLDRRADDAERRRAIVSACDARNDQSEAILRFLGRVNPSVVDIARKDFPIEESCDAYADEILDR